MKKYYDSDGNECSIHQMVQREPEWAVSVIQEYEQVVNMMADALRFYLADDERSVEGCVLESVEFRPAYSALKYAKPFIEKAREV